MTAPRVTADDLRLAAEWSRAYDGGPEDDNGATLARVAAWLDAEAARREEAATVRRIARDASARHGRKVTEAEARAALRRTRAAT
jgi:hypothetical protein